MKRKMKNITSKKNIAYSIGIISICIVVLIIIYITKSQEGFRNSRRRKFLYKRKYKCHSPHLVPSFSPDLCCVEVNGRLRCDYTRNCKCKNKRTGICETCYPRRKKFDI